MSDKKGYAFRCKACNTPLTPYEHSKLLPDDTEDDLCNWCQGKTYESYLTEYTEVQHQYIQEGLRDSHFNLDYFDNL